MCVYTVDDVVDESDDNEETDAETENDTENEEDEKDQRTAVIFSTHTPYFTWQHYVLHSVFKLSVLSLFTS